MTINLANIIVGTMLMLVFATGLVWPRHHH